jgi:predicted nucleic acid-binding Zn ribbon protein
MEDNWNRNDYQGRSRKNVETNYRILFFSVMALWLVLVWWGVYELINYIF